MMASNMIPSRFSLLSTPSFCLALSSFFYLLLPVRHPRHLFRLEFVYGSNQGRFSIFVPFSPFCLSRFFASFRSVPLSPVRLARPFCLRTYRYIHCTRAAIMALCHLISSDYFYIHPRARYSATILGMITEQYGNNMHGPIICSLQWDSTEIVAVCRAD